ncbi:MAG TPA: 3-oxoacid CoA-transferase subunit B [Candidatus Dormibacteraeota bacterium]|nr:3-oxoacid CoA-transferase subunit B [Candidatus Dormibacteraeota bacterium]
MSAQGWTPQQLAARLARDIPDGAYVNLGIGMPTMVTAHIPPDREVMHHSENGIVGMGPPPPPGEEDRDLMDAGKNPCTLALGASICDHTVSFTIIRGGRLDIAVLGGMQVSARGDLANWRVAGQALGSVGGAMDLAAGARQVWVMMTHTDKSGRPKLVDECTYPLTAACCVTRVYTTMGVLDVEPDGLRVIDLAPGVDAAALEAATEPPLRYSESLAGAGR